MKKLITLTSIMTLTILLTGCGKFDNKLKHLKSNVFGLNRTITLYGNGTNILKTWHTQSKVEDSGGSCYFLDNNKKAVIISGTFIIQEN